MPRNRSAVRRHSSRLGRPTREHAQQRHEELLDEALEQFLEKGFVMTTIEGIASAVGMTKRTVYARYPDKEALFEATVQRAIERWLVPIESLKAVDLDDLEGALTAIAYLRMKNANSPAGLRLQRILASESYRFPGIFALAYDQGTVPTIRLLARLLRRHSRAGTIKVSDPETAAIAFLSMVIGTPIRALIWGESPDERVLRSRVKFCVQLFLDGLRVRPATAPKKTSSRRRIR